MAFLVSDTTVELIDAKSINMQQQIPVGIYKPEFNKFRGLYLVNYEYKTSHGKIYGNAQKIADHIVAAFQKRTGNVGVLLSGGKGLGKSLTARLVIEELSKTNPIIVVSENLPGLFDFLKEVSNAVILFDEFEKTMKGHSDGSSNDTDAMTVQEEMLSVLDGTSAGGHNLYLLTCNEVRDINQNMKSRPGRILYHYRYESCDEETIRNYCADNLQKKEYEDDIVSELLGTRFVSLDIIKAMVDEVNLFDVKPDEVMKYLNIDIEFVRLQAKMTYLVKGQTRTAMSDLNSYYPGIKSISFNFENTEKEARDKEYWEVQANVEMKNVKIPLFGTVDVSDIAQFHIEGHDDNDVDNEWVTPEVLSIEIGDVENMNNYTTIKKVF